MRDERKTRQQLLRELGEARERLARLEPPQTGRSEWVTPITMEAVMRALPDLFFQVGADFTILGYKAGRPEDLYAPPEQFLGKRMADVLPPQVARTLEQATLQALGTGAIVSSEYALPLPQGEQVFEARVAPLAVDQVIQVIRNITPRRRAEEALLESEGRYRALVEGTGDWVWEVDTDTLFSYVSPQVEDLTGYTPEEVLGKSPFDFIPPEDAGRVEAVYWPALAERQPFRLLENVNRHRDGRLLVLESSAVPFFDSSGRFCGYRGVDRDITDRKQAERLREEYLSLISHDLRAPLAVVMGQADWLRRALGKKGLERETRSVESILKGARRMNSMLEDLVESARLESGRMEMHQESTDLPALISEVVQRTGTLQDRSRIRMEAPRSMPPVPADPARIERVVTNLVSNALKYSSPGTSVVIRVSREERHVLVSVIDQGAGIPPEDLAHLFERFYRARAARKVEGLGLGLYVSRLIVEAHGGRIWAESREGKGSTFSFALPLEGAEP